MSKTSDYHPRKAVKPVILTARFIQYTVVVLVAIAVTAVVFVLRSSSTQPTLAIPVTGLSNPALVPAENTAAKEPDLSHMGNEAVAIGPDYVAMDIRMREKFQITEPYEFVTPYYAAMAPQERERLQITEPYDGILLSGAALTPLSAISTGPDNAAVDIRLREQNQITEAYPFTTIDYASMTPSERQRLQITEDYP